MPRYLIRLLAGIVPFAIGVSGVAAQERFQPTEPYWGGVYIGAHAGYGWGKTSAAESGTPTYNLSSTGWSYHTEGLLGGVRVGYDWESYALILGVEAGLGYLSVEGDGADPSSGGLDTVSILASGPYAELTGRIGFAPDRWLYYMKAGAVFADLDLSVTDSCPTNPPCSTTTVNALSSDIETGWTAGIGIGYALSQHWNATLDYQYIHFEDVTVSDAAFSWDHDLTINSVTAGLAFRF